MKRFIGIVLLGSWALLFCAGAEAAKPFTLKIQRNMTCSGNETIGSLSVGNKEIGRTLELPWRQDARNVSRVQAGKYRAKIRQDGNLGWRIELSDVQGHDHVELHMGNFARNTKGCILVGLRVSNLKDGKTGQGACAVAQSADALAAIRAAMQKASDNGLSSQPLDITVVIAD